MPEVNDATQNVQVQNPGGYDKRAAAGAGNASLSIEDFYKLLAAQLKYQDADNPMDTSEMMAQMVQTQMIETINQMNQINLITYASSMIGKQVTVAELDPNTGMTTGEVTQGVVTGASIFGDTPRLFVDGKMYYLSQVTLLGETGIKEPEEDKGDEEDPDAGKTPGVDDKPDGTPGTDEDPDGTPGVDGDPDGTPGTDGEPGGTPGVDEEPGKTPGTDGAPDKTPDAGDNSDNAGEPDGDAGTAGAGSNTGADGKNS